MKNQRSCAGVGVGAVLALAVLVACPGCARRAQVTLQQDFAPPSQRLLTLESDQAFRSSDGERQGLSLSFPLPGARQGPRAFVVYIEGPDGNETFLVDPRNPAAHRGFLVQEVGALKGKSVLASGTIRYQSVPLRPLWRRVTLDLRTQDGAILRGEALAKTAAIEVRNVRRRYAADVRVLRGDSGLGGVSDEVEGVAERPTRVDDPLPEEPGDPPADEDSPTDPAPIPMEPVAPPS